MRTGARNNMVNCFTEKRTLPLWNWLGLLGISLAVAFGAYAFVRALVFKSPSKEVFGFFLSLAFIFAALYALKSLGVDLVKAFRHHNSMVSVSLRSAVKYLLVIFALGALVSALVLFADFVLTKLGVMSQDSFGNLLIPEPSKQSGYISGNLIGSPARIFLFFFVSCLLAPIGEELVFRRLLYVSLRKRFSAGISLLVSSVVFGVFHGGNWFVAFGKGLVFGYEYEKTGNILAVVFLHMLVNLFALAVAFSLATV